MAATSDEVILDAHPVACGRPAADYSGGAVPGIEVGKLLDLRRGGDAVVGETFLQHLFGGNDATATVGVGNRPAVVGYQRVSVALDNQQRDGVAGLES